MKRTKIRFALRIVASVLLVCLLEAGLCTLLGRIQNPHKAVATPVTNNAENDITKIHWRIVSLAFHQRPDLSYDLDVIEVTIDNVDAKPSKDWRRQLFSVTAKNPMYTTFRYPGFARGVLGTTIRFVPDPTAPKGSATPPEFEGLSLDDRP